MVFFNKKGAIFFTLDAFIAGIIIVVTVILVLSIFSSKPAVDDVYLELGKFVDFVSSTSMLQIRDKYNFVYHDPFESDLDLFVHQKMFKLVSEGNRTQAEFLIGNLSAFLVPSHIGFKYEFEDFSYVRGSDNLARVSVTNRLLSSFVFINEGIHDVKYTVTNITVWS